MYLRDRVIDGQTSDECFVCACAPQLHPVVACSETQQVCHDTQTTRKKKTNKQQTTNKQTKTKYLLRTVGGSVAQRSAQVGALIVGVCVCQQRNQSRQHRPQRHSHRLCTATDVR